MPLWINCIILSFIAGDFFVWWRIYHRLGAVRNHRRWRWLLAYLMALVILFPFIDLFAHAQLSSTGNPGPRWLTATFYLWHFLILPPLLVILLIDIVIQQIRKLISLQKPATTIQAPAAPKGMQEPEPASLFSRRHFLTAALMTAPPLATASLATVSMFQIGRFRTKAYDIALPGWPRDLHGFTITVVADLHHGAFSTPKMLKDVADRTNELGSDLILLAGDLVNLSHADIPSACDMVNRMRAKSGIYMIQGNHDCVQGPGEFDAMCRARGVNLLVDEVATINTGRTPFQILGTRWTDANKRDASVALTVSQRDPNLFPIMLAHHPHSWDAAASWGIPFVLSGHTHGGQIMLTNHIGGGPLRFKYWSGLYSKPNSQLLVSNGVGNWFPLRVNVPAEILHVTLRALA